MRIGPAFVRARRSHSEASNLVSPCVRRHRQLAVALAGVLATACGAPATRPAAISTAPRVAQPIATLEVASAAVTTIASIEEEAPARIEPSGPTILVERALDPNRVAPGAVALIGVTVERTLGRAGFSTAPAGDSSVDASYVVTPTMQALTVAPEGSHTTITCSITLRVSPWSAAEQVERWEAQSTASASGEARATTSNARGQVELGIRECLEGAVRAAAARQVIPFLTRMTREPRNVSDSSSSAEL